MLNHFFTTILLEFLHSGSCWINTLGSWSHCLLPNHLQLQYSAAFFRIFAEFQMTVGVIIQLPLFIIMHISLLQVADNAGFIFYCTSKYSNQGIFGNPPPHIFAWFWCKSLTGTSPTCSSKATFFFFLFHLYPSFS